MLILPTLIFSYKRSKHKSKAYLKARIIVSFVMEGIILAKPIRIILIGF